MAPGHRGASGEPLDAADGPVGGPAQLKWGAHQRTVGTLDYRIEAIDHDESLEVRVVVERIQSPVTTL